MEPEDPLKAAGRGIVSRAFLKAAELVGGLNPLQTYLQVDRSELFGWIVGAEAPPYYILLRVVDVLVDPQAAQFAAIEHRRVADAGHLGDDKPPE